MAKSLEIIMPYFLDNIFYNLNRFKRLIGLLKTQLWYKIFLKKVGANSRIYNPMTISNPSKILIGRNVIIRDYSRLEVIGDGQLNIGDNVSIEQSLSIVCAETLNIGANTTISFRVMITDVEHSYAEISKHILKQSNKVFSTSIGDNCFIGAGVCILAGTILGKQCIVGTNSVVRGEFPDYSVIVGSPAKIVKRYDTTQKVWRKTDASGNFL